MKSLPILLMTLFVVYFSGCGDSDSRDNNTSSSSISAAASSSSHSNSSEMSSSIRSSTGNLSSVDNTGNALNSLGYYGKGVYLGDEPILGKWKEGTNGSENGSTKFFYHDGTGFVQGTYLSFEHHFTYGVDQNGTVLFVHSDGTYRDGEPIIEAYECLRFEDKCCYLNTDTNLTLCKVAEENVSN